MKHIPIRIVSMLAALALFTCSAAASANEKANPKIEQELIRLDKQWIEAEQNGDARMLGQILAADYVFTDLDGKVGDRSKALAHVGKAGDRKGTITAGDYQVHVHGSAAVMTHSAKLEGANNPQLARAMHVWVKRGGRWQVVAHQWTLAPDELPPNLPREFLLKCARYCFEPEVYTFFGNASAVLRKIRHDGMGLPDRRGYAVLIESDAGAELVFFDRVTEKKFHVTSWSGDSAGDLRERLTTLIMENKGIACIGQQAKSVMQTTVRLTELGTIPTPTSALAAFSHVIRKHEGEYLRVSFMLFC